MPKNLALLHVLEQLHQKVAMSSIPNPLRSAAKAAPGDLDAENASLEDLRRRKQQIEDALRKRERQFAEDSVVPELQALRAKHQQLTASATALRSESENLEHEAAQLDMLATSKRSEARGKRVAAESRKGELNASNNRIRELEKLASARLSCWIAGYSGSVDQGAGASKRPRIEVAADESWSSYQTRIITGVNGK
jgi:uncharacterized protein (DUF3084 family)